MIETFSAKIGNYISVKAGTADKSEAVSYGCEIVIRSLIKVSIISLVSFLLGIFYETWTIIISSALLRSFSGGIHCSTYTNCLFTSTLIFTVLGLFTRTVTPLLTPSFTTIFLILSTLVLFSVCFFWIPVGSDNRPLTENTAKNKFKICSAIIIGLHFCISFCLLFFDKLPGAKVFVFASTIGMLWQGFTVTPVGYHVISKFDHITKHVGYRKWPGM